MQTFTVRKCSIRPSVLLFSFAACFCGCRLCPSSVSASNMMHWKQTRLLNFVCSLDKMCVLASAWLAHVTSTDRRLRWQQYVPPTIPGFESDVDNLHPSILSATSHLWTKTNKRNEAFIQWSKNAWWKKSPSGRPLYQQTVSLASITSQLL